MRTLMPRKRRKIVLFRVSKAKRAYAAHDVETKFVPQRIRCFIQRPHAYMARRIKQ